MATLSKRLDLADGIWQEIGDSSVILQNKNTLHDIEVAAANAVPVGEVAESFSLGITEAQYFPAPASGSLYVRLKTGTGYVVFYKA